jgi:hypothetical protein
MQLCIMRLRASSQTSTCYADIVENEGSSKDMLLSPSLTYVCLLHLGRYTGEFLAGMVTTDDRTPFLLFVSEEW